MATVRLPASIIEEFYNKNHSKSDGKFTSGSGGSRMPGNNKLPQNDAEAKEWQKKYGGPTERSRLDKRGPNTKTGTTNYNNSGTRVTKKPLSMKLGKGLDKYGRRITS